MRFAAFINGMHRELIPVLLAKLWAPRGLSPLPQKSAGLSFRDFRAGRLAFESAPERRVTAEWRLFHDDETGALKVAHDALGGDSGHVFVGLVNTLSAFEPQRKGDCGGEVARIGGGELLVVVGHRRTIARQCEQSKNAPEDAEKMPRQPAGQVQTMSDQRAQVLLVARPDFMTPQRGGVIPHICLGSAAADGSWQRRRAADRKLPRGKPQPRVVITVLHR
jgi:hypothetical protein